MTLLCAREKVGMEGWFKMAFAVFAVLYIATWLFTMQMAGVQQSRGYFPVLPVVPSDSQEYATLSDSLIQGRGFTLGRGPETYRVPGYPAFVAGLRSLAGGSYFFVTFIQIFLVFSAALIVRRIGMVYATSTVGGIAALLLLGNPVVLTLALTVMTDTLFLFLFVLGFYAASVMLEKEPVRAIIIAASAFSACLYVRAMGFFALPIFLVPFLVASVPRRRKIIAALTTSFFIALSLVPWMYRNYVQAGTFSYTSFMAINLAQYSVPMFWAWQNGTMVSQESDRLVEKMGLPHEVWRDIGHSAEINRFAAQALLEKPFSYLIYHLTLSLPFLFSSSLEYATFSYNNAMHIPTENKVGGIRLLAKGDLKGFLGAVTGEWWKFAERIAWTVFYALVFIGIVIGRKKAATLAYVFTVAYLMFLAGPAANARYAIQAQPFIFVLGACGLLYLIALARTHRSYV